MRLNPVRIRIRFLLIAVLIRLWLLRNFGAGGNFAFVLVLRTIKSPRTIYGKICSDMFN